MTVKAKRFRIGVEGATTDGRGEGGQGRRLCQPGRRGDGCG